VDIIVAGAAPKTLTAREVAKITLPKAFRPATAEQWTAEEASRRTMRMGVVIEWLLGALSVALVIGGLAYWALGPADFDKAEILPFPFVFALLALGGLWLFHRRLGLWPARFAARARDCPPPGPIAVSEEGLAFGGRTRAWASLRLERAEVVVIHDDSSSSFVINRLGLVGEDGPFCLDTWLMNNGQALVDAVYLRLRADAGR